MSATGLARRYLLGPRFLATWADQGGIGLEELQTLPRDSVDFLWSQFVLTTNRRGRELAVEAARRLTGRRSLAGRRTADVGSGHGGAAVGCGCLGAEALGIEPDPVARALAEANAADSGRAVRFLDDDLLDPELPSRLGRFDVVTANDVLEHLADPEAGVHALGALVRDGGLVAATIPNPNAVSFVAADGHYGLPGLTLLRRREVAVAYFDQRFSELEYSVGEVHAFDAYARWFDEAGLVMLEVEDLDPTPWRTFDRDLAVAEQAVLGAAMDPGLPRRVRDALAAGLKRYLELAATGRRLSAQSRRRLLTAQFWRIWATRGSGPHRLRGKWRSRMRRAAKAVPGVPGLVQRARTLRSR